METGAEAIPRHACPQGGRRRGSTRIQHTNKNRVPLLRPLFGILPHCALGSDPGRWEAASPRPPLGQQRLPPPPGARGAPAPAAGCSQLFLPESCWLIASPEDSSFALLSLIGNASEPKNISIAWKQSGFELAIISPIPAFHEALLASGEVLAAACSFSQVTPSDLRHHGTQALAMWPPTAGKSIPDRQENRRALW